MYGAAVSRMALLRNAKNGVTGKEVTDHIANVGQELTVSKHARELQLLLMTSSTTPVV